MRFQYGLPRAVCFDLYGTLIDISIDTEASWIWESLCAEFKSHGMQIDPTELHAHHDRLVEAERVEHGQPFVLDNLFFFKLLDASGRLLNPRIVHYFGRRFRALTTRHIQVKPYALELFRDLSSRGCKLAIVSNTEEIVTSHDLDVLGLRRHFDAIVLSSAVGVKKPEARIFHIALQRLGVMAHECVFIGDDYECDYRGPERAGLRPLLLFDDGRHPHARCVRPELELIVREIENAAARCSAGHHLGRGNQVA